MIQGLAEDTIVCVAGVGYVGYPLADVFSWHLRAIGHDLDTDKVAGINAKPGNRAPATTDLQHDS